jgi:hypothetical protein
MSAIAGLGAALLAAGLFLGHREEARAEPVAEVLGAAFLLVGIGSALLYAAISR